MSARTINLPRDPAAFWRAFTAAKRRLNRVDLQLDYMCVHWRPDLKQAIAKAIKRQKRARIVFEAFKREWARRVASAKKRGGDALARLGAPHAAALCRQRSRWYAVVDGQITVGRESDGTPVVEDVT